MKRLFVMFVLICCAVMVQAQYVDQKEAKADGFKPMCDGWYRKTFVADEAWKGLNVKLDFGGIIYYGDVYINGTKVASTDYGQVTVSAVSNKFKATYKTITK